MTNKHPPAQETQPTPLSKATNLNTLLQYQDHEFIEVAYQTLLQRQPDPTGLNYYLGRLRAGVSKLQILEQLFYSSEARGSTIDLPGLWAAVRKQRLSRLPLVGTLLEVFMAVDGNSALEVRLRAVEQQIYRLCRDTHTRLDGIEQSLAMLQRSASIELPETPEKHQSLSPLGMDVLHQLKGAIINKRMSQGASRYAHRD